MPPKRRAEDAPDARPPPAKRGRPRRTGNDQLGDYKVTKPRRGRRPNDNSFKRGLAKDIDDLVTQAQAYQAFVEGQGLPMGEIEFTFKVRKAREVKAKNSTKIEQESSGQPDKALETKTASEDSKPTLGQSNPPVPTDLEDEIDIYGDATLPTDESRKTKATGTTVKPASPKDKKTEDSKLSQHYKDSCSREESSDP